MTKNVSPLAPQIVDMLPALKGVGLSVAEIGIKYKGRNDVFLLHFDTPATVAGVFTQSKCASAPVDWCKQIIKGGSARAVLVNAGNANAFTGLQGWEAVRLSAELVAEQIRCPVNQVYLASTGVIGEPLDASVFSSFLDDLHQALDGTGWLDAAKAIMTTDTFPKLTSHTVMIDDQPVTVNGIAKGSGMIAPDMATMLAFIVTDAPISTELLQKLLAQSVDRSFNSITVDSDTSTSDTVLSFATGTANITPISSARDKRLKSFKQALDAVCIDLAQQIVRDGEGARKFVSVHVLGAKS